MMNRIKERLKCISRLISWSTAFASSALRLLRPSPRMCQWQTKLGPSGSGCLSGFLSVAVFLIVVPYSTDSFADSQRFLDYEYDFAGNIISIQSDINIGPPDVTNLSPVFVNKERAATIRATGVNLSRADVTSLTPGVTVVSVFYVSSTELEFTVYADVSAAIGSASIQFSTRLGSDVESLIVAERTPVISTEPNPILLSPTSQDVIVKLEFDMPFETDQTYDVQITDPTVASVSESQITLVAGETETSVTISALSIGSTTLEINQLTNFVALGIPVIVVDDELPAGDYAAYSKAVGVAVYIEQPASTTGPFVAKPVGVGAYIEQPANTTGPFVARPVGVAAYIEQATSTPGPFVSLPVGVGAFIEQPASTTGPFVASPVGVAAYIEQPASTTGPFVSQNVGSSYGMVADQVTPQSVAVGSSVNLVVDGLELDTVSDVGFLPSDGITQAGGLTVNPSGTQLTIPVDISVGASTGIRSIVFTTPSGDLVFGGGHFEIAN